MVPVAFDWSTYMFQQWDWTGYAVCTARDCVVSCTLSSLLKKVQGLWRKD